MTLKSTKESFKITKPVTSVHNLIIGKMYVWSEGETYCENLITGHKAMMYLKPKGIWGSNDHITTGKVTDEKGNLLYELKGRWSSEFDAINIKTNESIRLVTAHPRPKNWDE